MTDLDPTVPTQSPKMAVHSRHPVDALIMLLLVIGFFLGPLKLLGISWLSYVAVDGLALLVLLIVFAQRIAERKPFIAATPLSIPIVLLAIYCILELANPEAPFVRSILGLRSWVFYLGFYFVGYYTLRSLAQIERLYALLLTLGFLTGVYGIYQWQVGPESFAGWSDYYGQYARLAWSARSGVVFRAFSSFVAPGTFGGNMALLMLLAFSVLSSSRVRLLWRVLAGASFLVMGVGIAASGSRGPVAHLIIASVIALALIPNVARRVPVVLKAGALAGVAIVLVIFLIGPVVSERFATMFDPEGFFWGWFNPMTNGLRVALGHAFGMGLGYTAGVPSFVSIQAFQGLPTTNVDSGYGSAAAEFGLLGLALFVYFAVKVGLEGFRTWKRMPPSGLRELLLGPALFAAAYPIVSVNFQPQAQLPSSIYFWLLIGMLMKANAIEREPDANRVLDPQMHSGQ